MSKPGYLHTVEDEHGRYGFEWGPVRVVRLIKDPVVGYVLAIQTEHDEITVRVTPKGRRIQVEQGAEP